MDEPVPIDKTKILSLGAEFMSAMDEIIFRPQINVAMQAINSYPDQSNRNYFVTSDDLLSNAENLDHQGIFEL